MNIPSEWTFKSESVADAFDRHVREQLPWYEMATNAVAHIVRHYLPENGLIYDIGSSTGNIGRALEQVILMRRARFIGLDNSEEMVARYKGPGECVVADAVEYEYQDFDVCVAFLVLMFIPPSKRTLLLKRLTTKIRPGGCLIIFDKVGTYSGYLSTVLHRLTMLDKIRQGAMPADILAKEMSLGGVQRPLPAKFIEWIVPQAQPIFRYGEFAGWIIEGPE